MSVLVPLGPGPDCKATVIVPVANEERYLRSCLDSLLHQTAPSSSYEVIALINNSTDSSPAIAAEFRKANPSFALHVVERQLSQSQANVGTARRLLMDEASRRLPSTGAILSTDGDTAVARDWVETNLQLLRAGADAVGGDIALHPEDYAQLPERSRTRHEADDRYQRAVTQLESLLDPDPHDPWPRHHHHFGASLACRNSLYRTLGGLPAVDCLEDVAFVKAMRRSDAKLRHSPVVKVVTAARTRGRARIGLSSQLREWQTAREEPLVDSAAFLQAYFSCRFQIRHLWRDRSRASIASIASRLGISECELEESAAAAPTFGTLHDSLDLRGNLWRRMPRARRVVRQGLATEQVIRMVEFLADEERPGDNSLRATPPDAPIRSDLKSSRVRDLPWTDSPQQSA